MAGFGAREKTPANSPTKLSFNTPTKISLNVCISPRSKNLFCILCCCEETNPRYRYKLFENVTKKTAACTRIEQTLGITIESLLHSGIVCRKCDRQVTRLCTTEQDCQKLRQTLKGNYEQSLLKFKEKFGKITSKRLSYTTSPEKSSKKLHVGSAAKENRPILRQPNFTRTETAKCEEQPSKIWVSDNAVHCISWIPVLETSLVRGFLV